MANNIINTRIKLKYDTLANWTTNDPTLLQGELAIVSIPTSANEMQVTGTQPPQILFKVGPGKFSELPYASAKAADVYGWAKAASKPSYTASEVGAYSKTEIDNKFGALVDKDTTYTFAKTTKGFTITPKGGSAQTISFEYLTQTEIEALTVAKAKGISTVTAAGGSSDSTTFKMPLINANGEFVEGVSQYGQLGKGITVTTGANQPSINADINGTATKATQDGNGNNIVNTYATKTELSELEEVVEAIEIPVQSVNGKTGAVVLVADDIKCEVGGNNGKGVETVISTKVDKATTVNNKPLSGNVSLDSTDISYGGNTVVSKFGGKNVHECLDMLVDEDSSLARRITNVETVVNGTDADTMDSVAELIDYVKNHGTEVTEMQADIKDNANAIDAIEAKPAMGITTANITDWNDAVSKEHTHSNKEVLDGITSTKVSNWDSASTNSHTHSNKTVLDNTTASFTTALKTKVDGIEAGAEVNVIESISVNGVAATISNKAASVTVDGTKVAYGSTSISAASGKSVTEAINHVYSRVTTLEGRKLVEYDNTAANYYIIDCGSSSSNI